MPTYLDNLKARRDSIAAELAALDASQPGGKPDHIGRGGGTRHTRYRLSLYRELEKLNAQIASAELDTAAGGEGPFEIAQDVE